MAQTDHVRVTCTGRRLLPLAPVALAMLAAACDEDVSGIGSSLTQGEVNITVDSLTLDLAGHSVFDEAFDSRGTVNLLGSLDVPEYGSVNCSYVARLLPASTLNIPDSITAERVDSMSVVVTVPRGALAGDSLAPQQLKVYMLDRQLPDNITSGFDPTGYYDPQSPVGSRAYTLSVLGATDSVFRKLDRIDIPVTMSREDAVRTFEAYRAGNPAFAWPSAFAQYVPGIYVEPSFGSGCVADVSSTRFVIYYHYYTTSTTTEKDEESGETTTVEVVKTNKVEVPVFTTAPEVLNSNNISYVPSATLTDMASQGHSLVTSPGGYVTRITLPAEEILKVYNTYSDHLTVINNMSLTIPVSEIDNSYGLTAPPYIMMVKTSELPSFFAELKKPDGKTSFYAPYNATSGTYAFSSMREYIEGLALKGTITADDCDFTLLPVSLTTEQYRNPNDYYSYLTAVTSCTRYYTLPAMCRLDTRNARVVFTYSTQAIR